MPEPLEEPRGRCTPYAFFLNICREQCDKKRGDKLVDFETLQSLCWERWGRMTEEQKKRFVQMSECDQVRLDKEMREYKESLKAQTDGGVVVVREIVEEILQSVTKERRVRVHDQMNQQLPGGFGEGAQACLSEAEDEADNSDLEVVGFVSARPRRQPQTKDPEVVDLLSNTDSSSEDDLIVVKTQHNTIDPITKKQIVEPVRNKKCNHIYEKSTIYSMIDMARENSKTVRCPYIGCNQRDFRKNDLVKDKDVLGAYTLYSTSTSSSSSSNVTTDFEVTKPQEEAAKRAKKKRTERLSYSDVSDSSSSESDVPLSRVRNKRNRKPSSRLADSYACSDLDLDSGSGNSRVKRKQGKSPKGQTKNNIVH